MMITACWVRRTTWVYLHHRRRPSRTRTCWCRRRNTGRITGDNRSFRFESELGYSFL